MTRGVEPEQGWQSLPAGDEGAAPYQPTAGGPVPLHSAAPPRHSADPGTGWFGQPASADPSADTTLVFPRPPDLAEQQPGIPRIAAVETALLPRLLEAPAEAPTLVGLAERHGLRPAGYRPSLGAYLRDVWRYRQFIATYARGRIIANFGEARLGRFWQVLSPLLNGAVYFLIFGLILGTAGRVHNFIAYLCIGMFIFAFTQNVASAAVGSISGQLGLVRALQFPRASLPIAITLTQVESLIASVVVLAGICVSTHEPVRLVWLYLVPALLLQFVFNLGFAFTLARLGSVFSDLRQLLPYVLRTWMYCSGVIYSVSVFADHLPHWAVEFVHANPLLVYIELARYSLMSSAPISSPISHLWVMGAGWALFSLVFGFIYFWRAEPEYGRG